MAQMLVDADGLLVGASGGIVALVVALSFDAGKGPVGIRFPGMRGIFVQGRWLGLGVLLATLGLALWAGLDGGSSTGHACHAGGALFGAGLVGAAQLLRLRKRGISSAR